MRTTKSVSKNFDADRVARISNEMRGLMGQLKAIFPEREVLLDQILYALLTREHVLVFGTFGTGKSDLLHTLFGAFDGARVFSIALSKFMSEANLIGMPDAVRLREKGEVHYNRDGGILDADFAELDELFDSNAPLLRVLLGILNERQFKRGRQVEGANLHTAVACTNGSPDKEVQKQAELGAVVDRFLFQCRVDYLKEAASRQAMYLKYLSGAQPETRVSLDDLKYLSGIVVDANQITDEYLVQVYDRLLEAFVAKTGKVVSDRRRCKLLQLAEANALLFGRYDVDLEDLLAARWGLCLGGDTKLLKDFDEVAAPIIAEAKAKRPQNVDEVQAKLLAEYETKAPTVPAGCDSGRLVEICRQITALAKQVQEVRPLLPSTLERQKKLLDGLTTVKDQVLKQIEEGA